MNDAAETRKEVAKETETKMRTELGWTGVKTLENIAGGDVPLLLEENKVPIKGSFQTDPKDYAIPTIEPEYVDAAWRH